MSGSSNKNNPIQSFLQLPDDPNEKFDAEEINSEIQRINTFIDSNITTSLLTTNTVQTVSGAKIFDYLFYTGTSTVSYESVMSILDNDISPISGNGYKSIVNSIPITSDSDIRKLAFINENISGRIAPLGSNNPIFLKSNVKITSTDGVNVSISAKNIPLSSYDQNKSGTSPGNGNSANAKFWNTSVSYEGTINRNDFIGFDSTPFTVVGYTVIIAKKDTSSTADCLVVAYGNESSISSDYKSYKKIGFLFTLSGTVGSFVIHNNLYTSLETINQSLFRLAPADMGNAPYAINSGGSYEGGLYNIVRANCLVEIIIPELSSSAEVEFNVNNNSYLTTTGTTPRRAIRSDIFRIPFVWDGNKYLDNSFVSPPSMAVFLRKIWFGSIQ